MKTSIEIDLSWIGEDGSIDEAVKNYIVEAITEGLSRKFMDDLADSAKRQVNEKLDTKVAELFDSFMDEGIIPTDKWGDPIRSRDRVKIRDLMKEKLDKALAEKVNKNNGELSNYDGIPRIEYLLNKRVNDLLESRYGQIMRDVENLIKTKLGDTLTKTVGKAILAKMDINEIVSEAIKA